MKLQRTLTNVAVILELLIICLKMIRNYGYIIFVMPCEIQFHLLHWLYRQVDKIPPNNEGSNSNAKYSKQQSWCRLVIFINIHLFCLRCYHTIFLKTSALPGKKKYCISVISGRFHANRLIFISVVSMRSRIRRELPAGSI